MNHLPVKDVAYHNATPAYDVPCPRHASCRSFLTSYARPVRGTHTRTARTSTLPASRQRPPPPPTTATTRYLPSGSAGSPPPTYNRAHLAAGCDMRGMAFVAALFGRVTARDLMLYGGAGTGTWRAPDTTQHSCRTACDIWFRALQHSNILHGNTASLHHAHARGFGARCPSPLPPHPPPLPHHPARQDPPRLPWGGHYHCDGRPALHTHGGGVRAMDAPSGIHAVCCRHSEPIHQ